MDSSSDYQHPERMHHGPTKVKKDLPRSFFKRNDLYSHDDLYNKTIHYTLTDKVALGKDVVKQRYDDGSSFVYPKTPRGRNGRQHQKQAANKTPEDSPDYREVPTPELPLDKQVEQIEREIMMGHNNTIPRSGEFTMECLDAPKNAFTIKIAKPKHKGRARKSHPSNAVQAPMSTKAAIGGSPISDASSTFNSNGQVVPNVPLEAPTTATNEHVEDGEWLHIGAADAPSNVQSQNGAGPSSFGQVFSAMATKLWGGQ